MLKAGKLEATGINDVNYACMGVSKTAHAQNDISSAGAGEHSGQESQELSAADGPSFSQRHLGTWLHKGSWTGKDPEGGQTELDAIRKGESRQIPVFKIAILVAMFAGEQPSLAWVVQA